MSTMLPQWMRLGPWLILPVKMALMTALLCASGWWLARRASRGLTPSLHWTERARLTYPSRLLIARMLTLGVLVSGLLTKLGEPFTFETRARAFRARGSWRSPCSRAR